MSGRRVVVTGLGLVTPLACGVEPSWRRLLDGQSGAGRIARFDAGEMSCQIACELPDGESDEARFDPAAVLSGREIRRVDRFIQYGMVAAEEAVLAAGLASEDPERLRRIGVLVGSGIGGLPMIEEGIRTLQEQGPRRVGPFFIPGSLINLCSGNIAIRHGFQGPNHAVVTACSSGAHAIGDSAQLIARGAADAMVAGGAEAAICPIGIAGFAACRALSTGFNDDPQRASRPFDSRRDGFVMGEGAGIVVLEEMSMAQERGAPILAEVTGYGMSGDAHHITSPAPSGEGAARAMAAALDSAGLAPGDIDHINAHATSTPAGDEIEIEAMRTVFGDKAGGIAVSATKSAIGHLLGAAGAVEAVFAMLALRDGVAPPTLNLEDPDCGEGFDLTPGKAAERPMRHALSNSFGFGGTNASLVLSAPSD